VNDIPSIRSVMTTFPYLAEVDDSLIRARALMVEHQIRHLRLGATCSGLFTILR